MFELNFLKFMREKFPNIPTYSFFIPESAPVDAYCFENAGSGIATIRMNDSNVVSRTIKLTFSTNDASKLFNDKELTKYIERCHLMGDVPILKARILNFTDRYFDDQKVFERIYTINFKYKDTQ